MCGACQLAVLEPRISLYEANRVIGWNCECSAR